MQFNDPFYIFKKTYIVILQWQVDGGDWDDEEDHLPPVRAEGPGDHEGNVLLHAISLHLSRSITIAERTRLISANYQLYEWS